MNPLPSAILDGDGRTLEIKLANLAARDVQLLQNFVALLTDPGRAKELQQLRAGVGGLFIARHVNAPAESTLITVVSVVELFAANRARELSTVARN